MNQQVIGIGAWDRSGSTILAEVLGSSPDAIAVGELNNLWERGIRLNRPCGCGALFSQCPFWGAVMDIAFPGQSGQRLVRRVVEASEQLSNHGLMWQLATGRPSYFRDVYVDGLTRLHTGLAEVSGGAVIVDSTKMPWHLDATERIADLELWLLHLVRDPRGVVNSHRRVVRYDNDESSPRMMEQQGWLFATAGWGYRNLLLSLLWADRDRYLRVTYEEFSAHPAAVSREILSAVGVAPPVFTAPDEIVVDGSHSVAGNPVRFANGPAVIRPDVAWRRELPPTLRAAVATATLPLRWWYAERGARLRTSTPMESS